jgi:hypothetical protein
MPKRRLVGPRIELVGHESAVDRRRLACARMDQFFSIVALSMETLWRIIFR